MTIDETLEEDPYQSKEIYVGNLPDDVVESQLEYEFSAFGEIELIRIRKATATSNIFAVIKFQDKERARKAHTCCKSVPKRINDQKVFVDVVSSAPLAEESQDYCINPYKLILTHSKGLPLDEGDVRKHFSRYGPIVQFTQSSTKPHEGVLTFYHPFAARLALNEQDKYKKGQIISRLKSYTKRFSTSSIEPKKAAEQKTPAPISDFKLDINFQDGKPIIRRASETDSQDSSSKDIPKENSTKPTQINRVDFLQEILTSCDGFKNSEPKKIHNPHRLDKYPASRDLYFSNGRLVCADFSLKKSQIGASGDSEQDLAFKNIEQILDYIKRINTEMGRNRIDSNVSVFMPLDRLNPTELVSHAFGLQFGNLAMPDQYCFNPELNYDFIDDKCRFVLSDKLSNIEIEFPYDDTPTRLEIPYSLIEDKAIYVSEQDETVELIIPCSKPPFAYLMDELKFNTGFKWEDFQKFCHEDRDSELVWYRSTFPNSVWCIKLIFRKELGLNLINQLLHSLRLRLRFVNVKSRPHTIDMKELRTKYKSTNFDNQYYLSCLFSQYEQILTGKIGYSFVNMLYSFENETDCSETTVRYGIKNFAHKLGDNKRLRFHPDLKEVLLESIYETLDEEEKQEKTGFIVKYNDNKKSAFVRQATVTPSKIIFHFPQMAQSNRVIRFGRPDDFMRVNFVDEDLQQFSAAFKLTNMDPIFSKLKAILKKGITVCDRRFKFLAMSASQMRSHGCWMVSRDPDEIRRSMGDFRKIKCVGKYAARLGQSLSTSVRGYRSYGYKEIEDDYNDTEYNFTDGIGIISLEVAKDIAKTLELENVPSAFQIRYRGYKGVVAVNPFLDNSFVGYSDHIKYRWSIQMRKSMRKFKSSLPEFDILNHSYPIQCHLNRQVIQILSSLGIKDSVFEYFQDLMLKRLINIFIDPKVTREYIKAHYESQKFTQFLKQSKDLIGINYAQEPFFRDILTCIHKKQSDSLIKKSKIFVVNGRLLLGTIDEFNVLEEDEVFIQCTRIESSDQDEELNQRKYYSKHISVNKLPGARETFILDCPVIVTKNPAMAPGDLRTLRAVHRRKLEHMVDCIVFPARGYRPITNMCSGSDLDGDLYWVSWDERLIPKYNAIPLEYESKKAKQLSLPIEIDDVIEFFVDFIKSDQMGKIANTHTAIADRSPRGVADEVCEQLAGLFSSAVDFSKTGIQAEIPYEIWQNFDGKYPDFMEKSPSRTYISEKVIGRMYRKCKSILMNEDVNDLLDCGQAVELNRALLVDGYEKYLKRAKELYSLYRREIEHIINHFGLKYECELFSGKFMAKSPLSVSKIKHEGKEFYKTFQEVVNSLWIRTRQEFFSEFTENSNLYQSSQDDERVKKASAWYHVCYTSSLNKKKRVLSFPWVVQDVLLKPTSSRKAVQVEIWPIFDKMTKSICSNYTGNCNYYKTKSNYNHKIALLENMSQFISKLGDSTLLFIDSLDQSLFVLEEGCSKNKSLNLVCITSQEINDKFMKSTMQSFQRTSWKKSYSLKDASLLLQHSFDGSISIKFISKNDSTACLAAHERKKAINSIRLEIVKHPEIVVVAYMVLKMMHSDKTLVKELSKNGDKLGESIREFVFLIVIEFAKSNGYLSEVNTSKETQNDDHLQGNLAEKKSRSSFLQHLQKDYNEVLDQVEHMSKHKGFKVWPVSEMVMRFYEENAFEEIDKCPIRRVITNLKQHFSKTVSDLGGDQIKAFRDHFFKAIHILVGSPDVTDESKWSHNIRAKFDKLNTLKHAQT